MKQTVIIGILLGILLLKMCIRDSLLPVRPCAGIYMLEQSGYIPYVLSVYRPMIHRAYRLVVGGYGVPTAVPLPEVVFESLSTVGLSLRMGIGCHLVNAENAFTADW